MEIILTFLTRGNDPEQLLSLSGRLYYWELGLKYFRESWLFGHGFYTGHRFLFEIYPESNYFSNTFDNTWIDLLVDVGVLGVSLFLIFYFKLIKNIIQSKIHLKKEFIFGFIFLFVRSLTGATFETLTLYLIYLLLLTVIVDKQKKYQ